jgi:cytochrome c oxidase subunit 4
MLKSTLSSAHQAALRPWASLRFCTSLQHRAATSHAISKPTLANIEKRWEGMPPQEQADLWMALRDRMKVDWSQLTIQEKKAGMLKFQKLSRSCHLGIIADTQTAYYMAFGAHGPRALTPPGEGWKVLSYTLAGVVVSGALFAAIRMGAREGRPTMNQEYQEATNEYLRVGS